MGKASSSAGASKTTTTTTTITSSRTGNPPTTTTSASLTAASAAKSSSSGGLLNMAKRKKKKGRPSLLDLQRRQLQQQKQQQQQLKQDHLPKISNPNTDKTLTPPSSNYNSSTRRSTRRNPSPISNPDYSPSSSFDDDDERQQKKVKLVVRLPQSSSEQRHRRDDSPSRNSPPSSSAAASDSDQDNYQEHDIKSGDVRSNHARLDQGGKTVKTMGTVHGSSLESGPTSTPLPDRTMLVFILDRLQKKDTYGVFSEPVDPDELPDYHEIIEHPMDFGTVRKKLDDGVYTNLEELEADVMLICSNAMQYNSSDTVYFRQARSIQELAKRDFENLRNEGDNGEPQPKVVRRGRPPSRNLKKPIETSPTDRVALEISSGAALASGEDKASGSNGYNLRKGPAMLHKFRSSDAYGTSFRSRNGENYSDLLVDWNSEFPAKILRADMKYGKKHFSTIDETRRYTYKDFHPSTSSSKQSYFSNAVGDMKRLMSVGLHMDPHAYARSLARYAANLGPVAWNVASRKLKSVLPDGLAFGPGWVEENDLPRPFLPEKLKSTNISVMNHDYSGKTLNPSTPELSSAVHRLPGEIVEAGRRSSCQSELANQDGGMSWASPASGNSFQTPPQKATFHPNRNGFSGTVGFDMSTQMGVARIATLQAGHNQTLAGWQSAGDVTSHHPGPLYQQKLAESKLLDSRVLAQSGNLLHQASDSHMVPVPPRQWPAAQPDLNIRVQATSGSPSSSLQIGSPPPDLALQL